jgi:hypothetical protein
MFNSASEAAPYVMFEFDEEKEISMVVITNRKGAGGDRTKDIDVRLDDSKDAIQAHGSDSMWTGGRLLGHYAGPGHCCSGHDITIVGPGKGKVVVIQQFNGPGGNARFMNIAEVKIMGGNDESNSLMLCYI